MIDKELLDILACPSCKSAVRQIQDEIVCSECGRHYPIKNNIPVMMVEEAKKEV